MFASMQGAARLLESLGVGRGAGAGRGNNPQRATRTNHSTSLFPRYVTEHDFIFVLNVAA